jgi:hypothetical protein
VRSRLRPAYPELINEAPEDRRRKIADNPTDGRNPGGSSPAGAAAVPSIRIFSTARVNERKSSSRRPRSTCGIRLVRVNRKAARAAAAAAAVI